MFLDRFNKPIEMQSWFAKETKSLLLGLLAVDVSDSWSNDDYSYCLFVVASYSIGNKRCLGDKRPPILCEHWLEEAWIEADSSTI